MTGFSSLALPRNHASEIAAWADHMSGGDAMGRPAVLFLGKEKERREKSRFLRRAGFEIIEADSVGAMEALDARPDVAVVLLESGSPIINRDIARLVLKARTSK